MATFGFLEEKLAKAIYALTGSLKAPTDEAMMGAVVQQWGATLEKALTDTLNPLIDTFGKVAREHPESRYENLSELLAMLRDAAKLRNVICHGSWRPPNAEGASMPFFVNRQLEAFDGAIDCKWLDQLQRHTAELCANVVSSVTHMGYQFPGSNSPGRPLT